MWGGLLILMKKIMIFGFLIAEPYIENDMFVVVFGWLMIAPAVMNQLIQSCYSIYSQVRDRKKIMNTLKNICRRKQKMKKIRRMRIEFVSSKP